MADAVARGRTDAPIAAIGGTTSRSIRNGRLKFFFLRRPLACGPEWIEFENRELRRFFRKGMTDGEIADHLGRTAPQSIQSRRYVLDLQRLDEVPWTDKDDQAFRKMWQTSLTAREIAAEQGRSLGAVTQRRRRLGLVPRIGQEYT